MHDFYASTPTFLLSLGGGFDDGRHISVARDAPARTNVGAAATLNRRNDGGGCRLPRPIRTAPPLTQRTHRLHQRGYRRANTQHCRIYDTHGLAPTVSTTSAINVWADETRVRLLLQPRELARLQGLNYFHLPAGRVVATRLIDWQCNTAGAGRGFI